MIIDEYTRRCITLNVSRPFKSADIINRLAELFVMYSVPKHIRSDNEPEFISKAIRDWLEQLQVQSLYVELCSTWENGYVESFNSRLRDELLSIEQFANVSHARAAGAAWREDYNEYRPHGSLSGLSPNAFALRSAASVSAATQPPLQQQINRSTLIVT